MTLEISTDADRLDVDLVHRWLSTDAYWALGRPREVVETSIAKAPENYRKLVRIGSYGSFVNYYLCSIGVRVTDLQGRTAVFPVFVQDNGRCAEN